MLESWWPLFYINSKINGEAAKGSNDFVFSWENLKSWAIFRFFFQNLPKSIKWGGGMGGDGGGGQDGFWLLLFLYFSYKKMKNVEDIQKKKIKN